MNKQGSNNLSSYFRFAHVLRQSGIQVPAVGIGATPSCSSARSFQVRGFISLFFFFFSVSFTHQHTLSLRESLRFTLETMSSMTVFKQLLGLAQWTMLAAVF
jgi:hypothetical protein